jgi:hypothetical protein
LEDATFVTCGAAKARSKVYFRPSPFPAHHDVSRAAEFDRYWGHSGLRQSSFASRFTAGWILDLDPIVRLAEPIRRAEPLRHDAFASERMLEMPLSLYEGCAGIESLSHQEA